MARTPVLLLALLLVVPTASAWEASFVSAPSEASLAEALLLAGQIRAQATRGGFLGAPQADRLTFDEPVNVRFCPDETGEPQMDASCRGNVDNPGARIYIHAGGFIAQAPDAALTLTSRATAAALGGPNVTLNTFAIGPAIYTGGASVVKAQGAALILRPLGSASSIELRGDNGFQTYNGAGYTLLISGFSEATLEARGAFLGADDLNVTLGRAGLVTAEQGIRVEELFNALHALQPPERADRRAAVSGAFGLFQNVPALLDGAAAARSNLTLNDDARGEFTLVRLEDGHFGHDGSVWSGSGNATYMLHGETLAPDPSSSPRLPILVPIILIAAALVARLLTHREPARRNKRLLAIGIRGLGIVILTLVVGWTLAPLLGFSPLLDAGSLALRSRVQLALLVTGMVATAYVLIGLPAGSLTRSLFAWRERPRALIAPALVSLGATLLFILFATPLLLSFVARFVRL